MTPVSTKRWQVASFWFAMTIILILAAFAVRTSNHPGVCEAQAILEKQSYEVYDKETIWCPLTWTPTTTFTFFLVAATSGLWAFTALLWWTTQRAVNDGGRAVLAAVKAATAAETSAMAMVRMADVTEMSTVDVNRAYLVITGYNSRVTKNALGLVDALLMTPVLVNVGSTPARNVRARVGFYLTFNPSSFVIPDLPGLGENATGTFKVDNWPDVGRMEKMTFEEVKTDPAYWPAIVSGLQGIFIVGKVQYESVFTPGKMLVTNFCTRIEAKGNIQAEYNIYFAPHSAGNQAT